MRIEPGPPAVYVPPDRTIEGNFELTADPIETEPLVITAVRDKRLENNGFYARQEISQKVGLGVFFTREEIRRTAARHLTQLLQLVPGVRVIRDTSPVVGVTLDDFVLASEITAMEMHRNAAEMPAEFGGAVGRCGAIVIWTGTGGG